MPLSTGFENIVREGEPLSRHTWFRLGGDAEYYAEPTSIDELISLVKRCREEDIPVRLIGGGSNLLVRDEGVRGVVISLSHPVFSQISSDKTIVVAGGGAKLGHVISTAAREGLAGLESLVGIPGTIGGALHGNSGGHGGDIGQWATSATVLTRSGEVVERSRDDLVFGYRKSSLDELAILEAKFELEEDDPGELTKKMQKRWIVKKASQPLAHHSAGCIFRNPQGLNAGALIDEAGFKGTSVGRAMVSDRHANFIVAEHGASTEDVIKLIDLVKQGVADRLGTDLEVEIEVW